MKKLGVSLVAISSMITGLITATPAYAVDASCTKVITTSNSTYTGSATNEVICIDADYVTVNALAGNDKVIDYGNGNIVNLGNGNDEYDGTSGSNATVDGGFGEDTITGTPGIDELEGGEGEDDILGGAGADNINGGNGTDILGGNAGEDNIFGDSGDDTLDGGEGSDTLAGDAGDDTLIGGGGNDNMRGGEGNDNLNGSAGADNIWGEVGSDTLAGSEGDDIVAGGDGTDTLDGGWGLDLCDYNNNEVKNATCIYDDAAPEIATFNWDAQAYDVSRTSSRATATFVMTDEVASSAVWVTCAGNGVTAIPVDFAINYYGDAWTLSSRNGKSNLISVTEQAPAKPRTQTKFVVETTLVQGLTSGNYNCYATTLDRLDHRGGKPVADLAVVRGAANNWDDAAPSLTSFTWDSSSYDVTSSTATIGYTIGASDDSGIASMQVHCPGTYREIITNYMNRSGDDWTVGGGTLTSQFGGALAPTLGIETSVARGTKPGSYACYAWLIDIRGHQTWAPIKTPLKIVRTGTGWDDKPPALVDFEWDKPLYEVGAAADLAVGTLHMTDETGVRNIEIQCYGPTGQRPISIYLNKQGDTWGAYGINNPRVNSVTGTDRNLTIEFQSDVTFGLIPGVQQCYVWAYDSLGQSSGNYAGKMTVSRIPPGMPGAPTNLVYTPTPGNPNSGVLSWNEPEFLGEKVKDADGNFKLMPDGRYAGQARDYEIEYSTDGETWKRINDGFSYTANLPMSNLFSATDYYFRVRANNGGNDIAYSKGADWSEVLMVRTPDPTAPSAPTNLEVSNVTKSGAQLRWTPPATNGGANIFNFKVETSRDNGQTWQLVKKSKDRDINSTSVNLTVAGMAPGTRYLVRISAQNRWGFSEFLQGSITTLDGLATAPLNLTATDITSSTLTLQWDVPQSNGGKNITDYQVEVSGNGGNTWTKIAHDPANANAFSVNNLIRAKRYLFRVAAITELGVGNVSSVLAVTTAATAPAAPTGLVVSSVTTSSASLAWKLPSDNGGAPIFDYQIEISSDDGENWNAIDHRISNSRSFKINGMRPGTGYRVRVAAVNDAGFSEYVENSFTTVATTPTAPLDLTALATSEGEASLNWTIPLSNGGPRIVDYKIEVANNCKNYQVVPHEETNANGFTVTGLDAGTRYCFRVSAKNSVGFGAVSDVTQATTVGLAPSAPTGLSISTARTSIALGWSQAAVVGGSPVRNYIVEYSRDSGVTWINVTKPVSTSRSLVVSGLRSGTTYKFRVKSVNDVGESSFSNELTAVTRTK